LALNARNRSYGGRQFDLDQTTPANTLAVYMALRLRMFLQVTVQRAQSHAMKAAELTTPHPTRSV
jgi:hypothetical protein